MHDSHMGSFNHPKPTSLGLFTDLYELAMSQCYFEEGMDAPATFSLFVRKFPPNRSYFVSAGLEDVLRYLEDFHFAPEDIDYLHQTDMFSADFLDYLKNVGFTGEVWAMPEGRLYFCDEPILEITAPIIEAQLVETYVINQMNLQSLIATKAARTIWAVQGRSVVDFGLRRTQGVDAGLKVTRSSYIAGCQSTSNVLAGLQYKIPVTGTMAHSFVASFEHESDSFRAFARSFPDDTVLLIDTYDTIQGAHKAVEVGKEMEANGKRLVGVRLDSGDILRLSKEVRRILDEAGLGYVKIVASGGLDEYQADHLVRNGAPIDSFGVGTKMAVSADAPWLDIVYKLVRYQDRPVLKLSTDKASLPDEKQVFRYRGEDGYLAKDVVALRSENTNNTGSEPLLSRVMGGGKTLIRLPDVQEIRKRLREEFSLLPLNYKSINEPECYPVEISSRLRSLRDQIQQSVK